MKLSESEKNLFPHYKILDVVEGGMARVYHLLDLVNGGRMVAKTLRPEFASSPQHYKRFVEEGRLAMSIGHHPMLTQPITFSRDYGKPYLLMQWIDGWTLEEWCARRHLRQSAPRRLADPAWGEWWRSWTADEDHAYHPAGLLFYMFQVCHALEFLYAKGIDAHGDIHNRNILIRKGPQALAVLIDLGLARSARVVARDTIELLPQRLREELAGCWPYIAPELFRGDTKPTPRTDVYALGVTLYSALTGRFPYDVRFPTNDLQAMRLLSSETFLNSVPLFPEDLSDRYQACVLRCISPREEDRYDSAMSVREEITSILQEEFCLDVGVEYKPQGVGESDRLLLNQAEAMRQQDPEKAVEIIREILSRHLNDEHTRRASQILAQTLFEVQRFEEADLEIRRALACGPPSFYALNTFGLIQGALGRYEEAEQSLRLAIAASNDNTQKRIALLNLSDILKNTGRVQEAKAAVTEAQAHGEDARIFLRQAYDYYDSGNWQAAVQAARRVTELWPLDCEGWDVLGSLLYQMKQYEESYQALAQALDIRPYDPDMLGRMAYAAAFSGRSKAEILALLDRAEIGGGSNADILALRAAASTGDDARQYAMRALEEDPTHWLALNVLSSLPIKETSNTIGRIEVPRERMQVLAASVGLSEEEVLACFSAVARILATSVNVALPVPRAMVDELLSAYDREQVKAVCEVLLELMRASSTVQFGSVLLVLENLLYFLNHEDAG